jgi:hypothetical protein
MSMHERIDYLLRAASRAERNGEYRVARSLRRMARDIQPIDRTLTLSFREQAA